MSDEKVIPAEDASENFADLLASQENSQVRVQAGQKVTGTVIEVTDDAVFSDWLEEAKNPHSVYSKVRDDVKLDLKSKMLVLSTCMPSGDNRFIVQGVLIKDEKTE